jgi:leucyl-tRNA synthetase
MEMFGPNFENFEPEVKQEVHTSSDPSKAKKGKLNAKSTGLTYQFQILDLIGVPKEEIKTFADPYHWLHYFPPIAKTDLQNLGARIDWRRQFLTSGLPLRYR